MIFFVETRLNYEIMIASFQLNKNYKYEKQGLRLRC